MYRCNTVESSESWISDQDSVAYEGAMVRACSALQRASRSSSSGSSTSGESTPCAEHSIYGAIVKTQPAIQVTKRTFSVRPTLLTGLTRMGNGGKMGLCKDSSDVSIFATKAAVGGSVVVSPPQSPTQVRRSATPSLAGFVGHAGSCSQSVSMLAQTPPCGVRSPLAAVRQTVLSPRHRGGSLNLSACSSPSYSIRVAPPQSARSVPILHHNRVNRQTSVIVQPPLPGRQSERKTDMSAEYASSTNVQQSSIWGAIESILADTPRVPSPGKAKPHDHVCDDGQHAESGRPGIQTPQFPSSPSKSPSKCPSQRELLEGVATTSFGPVINDGKATAKPDKEPNVVRALSARISQPLAEFFSSRRNAEPERKTMPANSTGTQQSDVAATADPQLPMLYFSD